MAVGMAPPARRGIPRRDWILLPLISLATATAMAAGAEIGARFLWPEQKINRCEFIDQKGWVFHKPGCTASIKNAEGEWTEYRYNDCGYRDSPPCGAPPTGTLRMVVIGTSFAHGLYVRADDLFTSRVQNRLAGLLGKRVEFQNLGDIGPDFPHLWELTDKVLGLRPDGVFLPLVPYDLKRFDRPLPQGVQHREFLWTRIQAEARGSSRALYMAQHFMLQDESFIVSSFGRYGDPADISHEPLPQVTKERLEQLDILIGELADRLAEKGVPLFLVPMPNLSGAAMLHRDVSLPGVDPLAFTRNVSEIAARRGAHVIDVVPEIRRASRITDAFYPADGHPSGAAHALIADAVAAYFRENGLAALRPPDSQKRRDEHGKPGF